MGSHVYNNAEDLCSWTLHEAYAVLETCECELVKYCGGSTAKEQGSGGRLAQQKTLKRTPRERF